MRLSDRAQILPASPFRPLADPEITLARLTFVHDCTSRYKQNECEYLVVYFVKVTCQSIRSLGYIWVKRGQLREALDSMHEKLSISAFCKISDRGVKTRDGQTCLRSHHHRMGVLLQGQNSSMFEVPGASALVKAGPSDVCSPRGRCICPRTEPFVFLHPIVHIV